MPPTQNPVPDTTPIETKWIFDSTYIKPKSTRRRAILVRFEVLQDWEPLVPRPKSGQVLHHDALSNPLAINSTRTAVRLASLGGKHTLWYQQIYPHISLITKTTHIKYAVYRQYISSTALTIITTLEEVIPILPSSCEVPSVL